MDDDDLHGWEQRDAEQRRFLVATATSALVLLVLGVATGLREVWHATLLSVAVVALFPLLLIAGLLLLSVVGAFIAMLGHGDAHEAVPLVEGSFAATGMIPRYYRWLINLRNPVAIGVAAGAVLSSLLIWVWLAVAVFPAERLTAGILLDAKTRIEKIYARTGGFPDPQEHHLVLDGRVVRDAFKRPLIYERSGRSKLSSFTLTSRGYDGTVGRDDLCVAGSTRLLDHVETAAAVVEIAKGLVSRAKEPERQAPRGLTAIRALRCR